MYFPVKLVSTFSEDYPYKEVLDLMANRCLADRTNAWTDTDHTCYTVYTAGSNGFLNILPVYLDHIFHPLLREEDFMTEVHHINGDGDNAGVVYSEMQVYNLFRHQNLQNIRIRILQIFVLILFNDSATNNLRCIRKEY